MSSGIFIFYMCKTLLIKIHIKELSHSQVAQPMFIYGPILFRSKYGITIYKNHAYTTLFVYYILYLRRYVYLSLIVLSKSVKAIVQTSTIHAMSTRSYLC